MRRIERWIPFAIKAIKDAKITIEDKDTNVLKDTTVPKEYSGYISSFAASIVTSGLLPTVVFFSDENKSRGNRSLLPKAIFILLKDMNIIKSADSSKNIYDWILTETSRDRASYAKKDILDAATVLKLALRTFLHKKTDIQND